MNMTKTQPPPMRVSRAEKIDAFAVVLALAVTVSLLGSGFVAGVIATGGSTLCQ